MDGGGTACHVALIMLELVELPRVVLNWAELCAEFLLVALILW